jgi:hypothetical protein
MIKKLKKAWLALALTAMLALGVAWGGVASQSNRNLTAEDIQKPGHVAIVYADAAKQLDATTQSGGPTAAQNQKIQE